jgi:hypothetical protein
MGGASAAGDAALGSLSVIRCARFGYSDSMGGERWVRGRAVLPRFEAGAPRQELRGRSSEIEVEAAVFERQAIRDGGSNWLRGNWLRGDWRRGDWRRGSSIEAERSGEILEHPPETTAPGAACSCTQGMLRSGGTPQHRQKSRQTSELSFSMLKCRPARTNCWAAAQLDSDLASRLWTSRTEESPWWRRRTR